MKFTYLSTKILKKELNCDKLQLKIENIYMIGGCFMLYSALEIARYIITECTHRQKPLSNLKLQKILYFIWVDFFRISGRFIFYDDICAWQL